MQGSADYYATSAQVMVALYIVLAIELRYFDRLTKVEALYGIIALLQTAAMLVGLLACLDALAAENYNSPLHYRLVLIGVNIAVVGTLGQTVLLLFRSLLQRRRKGRSKTDHPSAERGV